jgi:hypothetical protein
VIINIRQRNWISILEKEERGRESDTDQGAEILHEN